jgi:hypothetical protein
MAEHFVESVAFVLRETFEGSPPGEGSVYLDQGVGVAPTLATVSAEQASEDLGGTTIAAQTEHAKFYLDRLCEFINGRTEGVNWEDSWLIETVNEAEWDALRQVFENSYKDTLICLAKVESWDEDKTVMAVGMVAHTAYHLGAIRQLVKRG